MKKMILLLTMVICAYSVTAIAEEWRTPEALRAFGKSGDTVRGSSTETTTNSEAFRMFNLKEMTRRGTSREILIKSGYSDEEILAVKRLYGNDMYPSQVDAGKITQKSLPESNYNAASGSREDIWQHCKRGYLSKLENPSTARFDDDDPSSDWFLHIQKNGSFNGVVGLYAVSGGSMKKFTGSCEGHSSDYSSMKVELWVSH